MNLNSWEEGLSALIKVKKEHIRSLARGTPPAIAFKNYESRLNDLHYKELNRELLGRYVQLGMSFGEGADDVLRRNTDLPIPPCKYPPLKGPLKLRGEVPEEIKKKFSPKEKKSPPTKGKVPPVKGKKSSPPTPEEARARLKIFRG